MRFILELAEPRALVALLQAANSQPVELLLAWDQTSALGALGLEELHSTLAVRPDAILLWDGVASDQELDKLCPMLEPLIKAGLRRMRLADLGALRRLTRVFPQLELQLDLRIGNHNLQGLNALLRHFPQVKRLALGAEWSLPVLQTWTRCRPVELEFPGLDILPLFHSPRRGLIDGNADAPARRSAALRSEQGQQMTWVEGSRGTSLLHRGRLLLLDRLGELQAAGVDHVRISTFCMPDLASLLTRLLNGAGDWKEFLKNQGWSHTRAFSRANHSDRQFSRLSRPRPDQKVLADVLDARRGRYVLVNSRIPLRNGQEVTLLTPEGRRFNLILNRLRDVFGQEGVELPAGHVLLPAIAGVSPGTLLLQPQQMPPRGSWPGNNGQEE
jgi:collagenase-like PrtC family protease